MKEPDFTTARGVHYSADCLEVLEGIRPGTIDTVFADPPFNIGKDYKNGYDDQRDPLHYLRWCEEWISKCCEVLKEGGSFFLYATPELAVQFAPIMARQLEFRHWIAVSMKGTFPRGQKLYPAHYALLYYTRGAPKTFNKLRLPIETCRHCGGEIKDYGGHRNKMHPAGVSLTDVWTDTSPNRHKKYKVRPGVNELKLMIPERALLMSTNAGDVVLDPFGGGGSTYEAAEIHDRHWIGMELYDSEYIRRKFEIKFPDSFGQVPHERVIEGVLNEDYQLEVLRRFKGEGQPSRSRTDFSGTSGALNLN